MKKTEDKVLKNTKALLVRHSKDGIHQEIYYEGGGEVPVVLQGKWTSAGTANLAISGYKAKK